MAINYHFSVPFNISASYTLILVTKAVKGKLVVGWDKMGYKISKLRKSLFLNVELLDLQGKGV